MDVICVKYFAIAGTTSKSELSAIEQNREYDPVELLAHRQRAPLFIFTANQLPNLNFRRPAERH